MQQRLVQLEEANAKLTAEVERLNSLRILITTSEDRLRDINTKLLAAGRGLRLTLKFYAERFGEHGRDARKAILLHGPAFGED